MTPGTKAVTLEQSYTQAHCQHSLRDEQVVRVPLHPQGLSQGHHGQLDSHKDIVTQTQGHFF